MCIYDIRTEIELECKLGQLVHGITELYNSYAHMHVEQSLISPGIRKSHRLD